MRRDTTGRDHVKTEIEGQFDFKKLQVGFMKIPYENTVMVENRENEVLATKPIITNNVNLASFTIESLIQSF